MADDLDNRQDVDVYAPPERKGFQYIQLDTVQVAHHHGLSFMAACAALAVVATPAASESVCSSATAATTSEGRIEVRQG